MYAFEESVESTTPIESAMIGMDVTRWMIVISGAEGCWVSVSVDIVVDVSKGKRRMIREDAILVFIESVI